MKVGFIAPQSIAAVNGGVRTQALLTARHLLELGVSVTFISPWDDLSTLDIDIFHVFSASIENSGIVARLHEQNKKIILSPVLFSNRSAANIRTLLAVEDKLTKLSAGIRSEFGHKKTICSKADLLVPNTSDEADLIIKAFNIPSSKVSIVPNGVEPRFTDSDPTYFEEKTGLKDFVLFAGQASAPRKNIQALLQAFQTMKQDLVIIGDFDSSEYSNQCLSLADKNPRVHLISTQAHDSKLLSSAYATCKVFVLPSQFETPGIAAMEAALAGANIAITEVGGTKDYFGNYAEYISPYSIRSISGGIQKALSKPKSDDLKEHILQNFTWDKVAEQTIAQYKAVLG